MLKENKNNKKRNNREKMKELENKYKLSSKHISRNKKQKIGGNDNKVKVLRTKGQGEQSPRST